MSRTPFLDNFRIADHPETTSRYRRSVLAVLNQSECQGVLRGLKSGFLRGCIIIAVLQLHFLVQDQRLHGFAFDTVKGHRFCRRLRLHGLLKRRQVLWLHADRDFIPCDREIDR